jgi:hypothetical protein
MKSRLLRVCAGGIVAHVAIFLLAALAQAPVPPPPQIPTLLRGGTTGELFALYIPRSESDIQNSLDFFRGLSQSATAELAEARRLALDADGRLKILNQEIETSKARRDVAKRAKDEGQRRELDNAVKQQERERKYLETLEEALQTNASRLESDQAAADAHVKALDSEILAARKHSELSASAPGSAEFSAYRDMLRNMFEAQRTAADLWADAGELRKRVAERQIRQLETLDKMNPAK